MIGNDIVDLKLAEKQSNWKRRGFLDKVFSIEEQMVISGSSEPDALVWRLWSMKESAYKAQLRFQKSIQINPKSFECQILSAKKGFVKNGKNLFDTLSEINNDFVHTHATAKQQQKNGFFSKVVHMNSSLLKSNSLYNSLISFLASRLDYDLAEMEIVKNSLHIPELFYKGEKLPVLCSFSHHGRYGSYFTKI